MGSIFRTAEGAGVEKIYLCGVTPDPVDRFGRKRNDLAKVALGTEDLVSWEHYDEVENLITNLKKDDHKIVAVEQDSNSENYKNFKVEGKIALVVGEEVNGIPREVLKMCDKIIEIPMKGKKESLNVSVATGIALFSLI